MGRVCHLMETSLMLARRGVLGYNSRQTLVTFIQFRKEHVVAETRDLKYSFGHPFDGLFDNASPARIGVIMGSRSDWPCMQPCADMLEALQIPFEFGVVSAHRTPERMREYAHRASKRGQSVIIACAGGVERARSE